MVLQSMQSGRALRILMVNDPVNSEDVLKQIITMTPLGRLGTPQDIASVVAFFAGEDSRWVTGQVLTVSGGL